MNPYEMFQTSGKLETQGIWLDYGDFKIQIARAGGTNVQFAKALNKHSKAFQSLIKTELIDLETANQILIETYADAVILDWDNVKDQNGEILKFSRDNVIKLLTDLPDLFRDIQEQAGKAALFRAEILKGETKNS